MKKFKLFALVFAIMLSATGLGLLFGAKQPATTQVKANTGDETGITATWNGWEYTLDEENNAIILSQYTGSETNVTILATATINSKTYKVWYGKTTSNVSDIGVSANVSTGTITSLSFALGENGEKVKFPSNCYNLFTSNKLTRLDLTNVDTSQTVNMSSMFKGSYMLESIILKGIDTSNVTDMSRMFSTGDGMKISELDLSGFNTSNVVDMSGMFEYSDKLKSLNLSSFNTQKVKKLTGMFRWCFKLTNLILPVGFGSACEDMSGMFEFCFSIKTFDLTNLDTSSATSVAGMFAGCMNIEKVIFKDFYMRNELKTEGQTDWDYEWDTSAGEKSILASIDQSQFNMLNAMYKIGIEFKSMSLPKVEYIATTIPNNIFLNKFAESIVSLNLAGVDVDGNNSIATSTSKLTSMRGMFKGCSKLESIDLSNFNTTNTTDMAEMFKDCSYLTSINLSNFNTTNTTNMAEMFKNCQRLTKLDVSRFNTSKVVDMSNMFYDVENVTKLDLSNFDTSKVQNMAGMFASLWGVTTIGYSKNDDVVLGERFTTAKVTNVAGMFGYNVTLTTLDISKFDLSKLVAPTATDSIEGANMMFSMCGKLAKIKTPTAISQTVEIDLPNGKWMEESGNGETLYQTLPAGDMTIVLIPNKYFAFNYVSDETYGATLVAQNNGFADVFGLYDGDAYTIEITGMDKTTGDYTMNITSYIGSRSDVIIPAYVKVTIGDMQITAIVKVACATDSTSFFGDKANNITSLKFGASVDPDNSIVQCTGLSKILSGLTTLTKLDLNRLEITDGSEDLSNVFNDCGALKNIKMPKTLKNTTTLNDTGLKGLENWYYVASGSASHGQNVIGTNAISVYANNILSTDGSKTYEQLNKVFSGEADAPLTPSTGVVVDVILPVACITLVLANVCALAFAGKKKKQF